MDSLLIPRNTTTLLQSIRERVNRGYVFWISGSVKILKAESLCNKFDKQYGVLATRQRRDYNHKLGRANSCLFMYPQSGGAVLDWVLIATEGKCAIHNLEKLRDCTSGQNTDRLRWRHYELVVKNGKLTWRLHRDVAEDWEKRIVSAARKSDISDLKNTAEALCNFPMFSGVRSQVWAILEKARKTRVRHHYDEFKTSRLPILRWIKVYDDPPETLTRLVDTYRAKLAQLSN